MKDLDLKIINDFIFPDETIKKEIFHIFNIKKMTEYVNEANNFSGLDDYLLQFYFNNISAYNKNDKKSQTGSFFHVNTYIFL